MNAPIISDCKTGNVIEIMCGAEEKLTFIAQALYSIDGDILDKNCASGMASVVFDVMASIGFARSILEGNAASPDSHAKSPFDDVPHTTRSVRG